MGDTPDYFNVCSTAPSFSIPINWGGYQVPASGNAYCGIGVYLQHSLLAFNAREFVQTQLANPLTIGTKYYVSFKTNLSVCPYPDPNCAWVNCAIKKMGVLFNVNQVNYPPQININYTPQVQSNNFITDTLNWTQVFGSFYSDSAYKYITLGNFCLIIIPIL